MSALTPEQTSSASAINVKICSNFPGSRVSSIRTERPSKKAPFRRTPVSVVRGPGVREQNQSEFQLLTHQKGVLRRPKLKLTTAPEAICQSCTNIPCERLPRPAGSRRYRGPFLRSPL